MELLKIGLIAGGAFLVYELITSMSTPIPVAVTSDNTTVPVTTLPSTNITVTPTTSNNDAVVGEVLPTGTTPEQLTKAATDFNYAVSLGNTMLQSFYQWNYARGLAGNAYPLPTTNPYGNNAISAGTYHSLLKAVALEGIIGLGALMQRSRANGF